MVISLLFFDPQRSWQQPQPVSILSPVQIPNKNTLSQRFIAISGTYRYFDRISLHRTLSIPPLLRPADR